MGLPIQNFINVQRFVENLEEGNSFGWYSICYELDRAKYEVGELTPIQYIMKYVYKLVFFMSMFLIAFIPVLIFTFVLYVLFTKVLLPIFDWLWGKIRSLVCLLMGIGIGPIKIIFFSLDFYPFRFLFNNVFGDIWRCGGIGDEQFNVKYGTCAARFGADDSTNTIGSGDKSPTECHGGYATDYTLWATDTDNKILCNSIFDCPNAPENQMLADSNILVEFFAPIITKGINKGTAPFKYLHCCDAGEGQSCGGFPKKGALKSLEYTNDAPDGYSGNASQDNIDILYRFYHNDGVNNFKPLNMYQATKRYFYKDRSWNFSENPERHNCKNLPRGGLFGGLGLNWFDDLMFDISDSGYYLKEIIFILIFIVLVMQIYNIFSRIKHGKEISDNWKNKPNENQETWEKNILEYLDFDKTEHDIDEFLTKVWGGDHLKLKLKKIEPGESAPHSLDDKLGTLLGTKDLSDEGPTDLSDEGPAEITQTQIIVICFIMITTLIVVGITKISKIKQNNTEKEKKVEIMNWPEFNFD